jgi:hypothetical protein
LPTFSAHQFERKRAGEMFAALLTPARTSGI